MPTITTTTTTAAAAATTTTTTKTWNFGQETHQATQHSLLHFQPSWLQVVEKRPVLPGSQ
jgi:hypothetical protein